MADAASDHLLGRDENLCLRFECRTLFVGRAGPLLLAVMTLPTVNLPPHKIEVHVVLRQFSAPRRGAFSAPSRTILPAPRTRPPLQAVLPARQRPSLPPAKKSSIWGD